MRPAPDAARHDRAKTIGSDRKARANGPSSSGGIAEHGASHGTVLIKESFEAHPIEDLSPSVPGRLNQLVIENSSGDREAGWPGESYTGSREQSGKPASGGADDRSSVERGRARGFQPGDDTQPVEQADCLRTHVLGTSFFTREGRTIYRDHAKSLASEVTGRGTARRSRAYD
jgi:hypothetical protein